MSDRRFGTVPAASLAIVLLSMPLAGCISSGPSFDSYEDAKASSGVELEPPQLSYFDNPTERPIRLKTLSPADPLEDTEVGENDLYFLLFNAETDEPITGAQMRMDVWKTHEDNTVSSHVQTPTHSGNGVYHGVATFDKPKGWVVDLTVTLPDGTEALFPLHYHAGETDHTHPDYFHPKDHEHGDDHGHGH